MPKEPEFCSFDDFELDPGDDEAAAIDARHARPVARDWNNYSHPNKTVKILANR